VVGSRISAKKEIEFGERGRGVRVQEGKESKVEKGKLQGVERRGKAKRMEYSSFQGEWLI